jgi:hypothetical protein
VCRQKKEKLRRSWSSSRMLVVIVKVRREEELISVHEGDEEQELSDIPGGLEAYPSHIRPVREHLLQAGFSLSHLMRRILMLCQLEDTPRKRWTLLACRSCIHLQSWYDMPGLV